MLKDMIEFYKTLWQESPAFFRIMFILAVLAVVLETIVLVAQL